MPQSDSGTRRVEESPVAVFRDEEFVDQTIRLDGRSFERCRFTRCIMQFGGTEQVSLQSNEFRDCHWVFVGPAALTLEFLSALYQGGAHELIEETFNSIRHGGLVHN